MPKEQNLPDYTGIPLNEKLIVQKSNPLRSLSETGMSLVEFKILDAYLSRIDSHDPDRRFVRFGKGELERLLGVTKISKKDLSDRLDGLFRVVTIQDKQKDRGFTKIALFEKAEVRQDEEGLWQVDLICTQSAMEYIFNIEVMGYLPYLLKNIIELTSRYSYVLYLYLEARRSGKQSREWTVSLEELKIMLRCTANSYNAYKEFNDKILKKCHKELTEKTSLKFSYEPIRRGGRKVTDIRFILESSSDMMPYDAVLPGQLSMFGKPEEISDDEDEETRMIRKYGSEALALFASAMNYEFSPEDTRVLFDLVLSHYIEPKNDAAAQVDFMRALYHRLDQRAADMALPPLKNRYLYLKKLLQNELKIAE